jgi:hypothetical protein
MENNNNFYNPATEKQIAYLKKLGYQGNTDGLTSGECSQLIMEYSGKGTTQASGTQATPKQEPSNAVVESFAANCEKNAHFQFLRNGFFSSDDEHTPENPVFNRTVSLKDGFNKKK